LELHTFSNHRSQYLNILFAICFTSGVIGAAISTLMPSYLPVVVKELKGNVSTEQIEKAGAVLNSIFLYGWMFGGIIWGILCDHYGRKKSIIFSTAFYAVFSLLTAIVTSWEGLILLRFLSGFGVGGVIVTTTIFISEAWNPSKRSVAIGMLTVCFPVGVFLSGAITYLLPEWRQSFLIGFIPLGLSIVSWWLLKEPQGEETINTQASAKVNFMQLFSASNKKNVIIGTITFGTMLIGLWAIFAWLPTWVQGLLINSDGQKERGLSMMSLAIAALLGSFFSGWFTLIAGWKKSMLLCFAVCFLCSLLLFRFTTTFSYLIYAEIGLLGFFFGVSQGVLSDFISKIFPANIRATATGFCFNAGRLVTATAVFFVGWLVNSLGGYGNSIFVFSFVFVFGFIAAYFVKEDPLIN
jgi:MFS family permease